MLCCNRTFAEKDQVNDTLTEAKKLGEGAAFEPWMVVERKIWRNPLNNNLSKLNFREKGKTGSSFDALANMEGLVHLENEQNKGKDGKLADF